MGGAFVRSAGGLGVPPRRASRAVAAVLNGTRRLVGLTRAAEVEVKLPDSVAWSGRVRRGGATVRCAAGSVWLTREGDPEDRVLEAGQSFRSEIPGRIAVLALGPACIVVSGDLAPSPLS